ncbi:MAG: helix-turn-helix domain-containing protein [Christensenella sp.]
MTNQAKNLTAANIKYLLVMKRLYSDEKGIRSTDIAKALGITKPSVHTMIKALQTMKLVKKDRYGIVWFTSDGKELTNRYAEYFETVMAQLNSLLPDDADTCSAACAMIAELTEEDIKAMCENINTETGD